MRFSKRVISWALLALVYAISQPLARPQQTVAGLQVDKNSVGGILVNANDTKPEACAWLIAETKL